MRCVARSVVACFGAFALMGSGCGGGKSTADKVSVVKSSPERIQATVMQTAKAPAVAVCGTASGDVASLSGKQIEVALEDPASLFEGSLWMAYPDGTFCIELWGRAMDVPGHFTGDLRIFLSLDAAGTQPLDGSPLVVPYDVEVLTGLVVDTDAMHVAWVFGDPAPTRSVAVTLSPYTTSWMAELHGYPPIATQWCGTGGRSSAGDVPLVECAPDGTVQVTLEPELPGTWNKMLRIVAGVTFDGRDFVLEKQIPISYTVVANDGVDVVFLPPAMDVTRTYGDNSLEEDPYIVRTNSGVSVSSSPVEYLTHPPDAEGHPYVDRWWLGGNTSTCYNTLTTSECLPVGTYTARVHYTLLRDGVSYTEAYYPITLTIVP